jgi:hypothetical protein
MAAKWFWTLLRSLGSGAAGAAALNALHQTGERFSWSKAPHLDILGERMLARGMQAMGFRPPRGARLTRAALLCDLATNSLWYALVGRRHPWRRGMMLGLLAGAGTIFLPPLFGLKRVPQRATRGSLITTAGLYLAGGLVSAAMARLLRPRQPSYATPVDANQVNYDPDPYGMV